jgi:hypothetical protein
VVQQAITAQDRLTFPCSGMFFSLTSITIVVIMIISVRLVLVLLLRVVGNTGVIGVASPLT